MVINMRNAFFSPWVVTAGIVLCAMATWYARPTRDSPQERSFFPPALADEGMDQPGDMDVSSVEYIGSLWAGAPGALSIDMSGPILREATEPQPSEAPESGFRFSDDHAGKLLAKALPPSDARPTPERATEPRVYLGASHVESPSLPLPQTDAGLPRVALAAHREPRPHL